MSRLNVCYMQKGDSGIHANQGGVTGNKLVFYADLDLDRKATALGVAIMGHLMEGNARSLMKPL